MPLRRLSGVRRPDGLIPIGAVSRRVRLEELDQEIWAHVSIRGEKAKITIPYIQGIRVGSVVAYESRRFRVEQVLVTGSDQQIRLECSEPAA
jgi:hypothetical protein